MNRKSELVLILCVALGASSVLSHAAIRWLKIKATWGGQKHYGPPELKASAVLHGSSPAYDGIDWSRVSGSLGKAIESWATAGSSPSEWERMDRNSGEMTTTFIGITAGDLNEYVLCDFRPEIVPLGQTLSDLRKCRSDWQFAKRMLDQYGAMYVRKLFPTVGRSDGVMVGIRAKVQRLMGRKSDAGETPMLGETESSEVEETVSDWSVARKQRRLVLLRSACLGKCLFSGPKRMALERLLQRAQSRGSVVLIVLPLPPIYRSALIPPTAAQAFEAELADLGRLFPGMKLVRLDAIPALESDKFFYDYVHLNKFGQQIATTALLDQLTRQGTTQAARD
jgi:hypothetical protein